MIEYEPLEPEEDTRESYDDWWDAFGETDFDARREMRSMNEDY